MIDYPENIIPKHYWKSSIPPEEVRNKEEFPYSREFNAEKEYKEWAKKLAAAKEKGKSKRAELALHTQFLSRRIP